MTIFDHPASAVPEALLEAVSRAMPEAQAQHWLPLFGGRINQLWRVGNFVIKYYDPEGSSPLFPNDPMAEAAALRRFARHGIAPQLRATGPGWLAYAHIQGLPWSLDPRPVALALTRLHRLPTSHSSFRQLGTGSRSLVLQGHAIAAMCHGALPASPTDPGIAEIAPQLIHGDAVPGNMIVKNDIVTMIDWQCPALGDPTEDLAAFLSPAMQWLYRGTLLSQHEADAFLAAFPPDTAARYRALAPLYHWRMAAHCLWKIEHGADDYRKALDLELDAFETV